MLRQKGHLVVMVACAFIFLICYAHTAAVRQTPAARSRFEVVAESPTLRPEFLMRARNGDFYGTSRLAGPEGGGVIFKVGSDRKLVVLHAFSSRTPTNPTGSAPSGPLLEIRAGEFLGVASGGGTSGKGTIFRMGADGTINTLHSFTGDDGASPQGALVAGPDGVVYGYTSSGPQGVSTVFALAPTGTLRTISRFAGDKAGRPEGLLLARDGSLYVTTNEGGMARGGTIVRITPAGVATTLHEFSGGTDSAHPAAAMTQLSDGRLVGTTDGGPLLSQFFSANPSVAPATVFVMSENGTITTLHRFDTVGNVSAVREGPDGNLYGTTSAGGRSGRGGVFQVAKDGSFTMLNAFSAADYDYSGVAPADDGSLWGAGHSRFGGGMIFRVTR